MWSVETIKKDYKKLLKIRNKSLDKSLFDYYLDITKTYIDLEENNFEEDYNDVFNYDLLEYLSNLYKEYKYIFDLAINFIYESTDFDEYTLSLPSKEIILPSSKEEVFQITNEFFKTFPPYLYHLYKYISKNKDKTIKFGNHETDMGYMYYIPYLKKHYIFINNTIDNIPLNLIHEYAHALKAYTVDDTHYNHYLFAEAESFFPELLANDFLEYSVSNITSLDLHIDYFEYISCSFTPLLRTIEILNEYNMLSSHNKKIFAKNLIQEDINHLLLSQKAVMKVVSYIKSIELYMTYLNNSDKAFIGYTEVLMTKTNESMYDTLKFDNSVKEYYKLLTRR